jgi:prepilin-type N-terminal cleavage/methylation domain-containing protein
VKDVTSRKNIRLRKTSSLPQGGMTLIELLIAMTVLAVGMGGMVAVFAAAIGGNGKAKFDTAGTMLAQTVLERIGAQPANSAANITMTDCNPGGAFNWTIATAPGGALLDANYNIDWINQTYAAVPVNYKMQFVACGNNGRQVTFEVRWTVQAISANTRLITVSARPAAAGNQSVLFAQPITLRGIGGT